MSYSILTVLIPGGTLWSQMKKYGIYFSWIVASGWMVLISTLELSWQRRCEEVMAIIMSQLTFYCYDKTPDKANLWMEVYLGLAVSEGEVVE